MPHGTNDVRPFLATHYNPEKVGDIGLCLSQPYDVIGPKQLDGRCQHLKLLNLD